jgi:cation diffusion facilitator CzcD-associated flavoprotein CzcO
MATIPERVEVLVVGAGISGIDAAYHLKTQLPNKSFVVLDALEDFGGTWRTHRYPGVRSDTDLFTFGYSFKPWKGDPIATGERILEYLGEVITDNNLSPHIHYNEKIVSAVWSSTSATWTVTSRNKVSGAERVIEANFLWMGQGYYKHEKGYTPEWPGFDSFAGTIIHPQKWPEGFDVTGKNVIVIGSGATAATLIPALAGSAKHVTMLQRSPTYFYAGENKDALADQLRALDINDEWIHEIVRRNKLNELKMLTDFAIAFPDMAKEELLKMVAAQLPEGFEVDKHFTPKYRPWQQRLAFVPDGDLFKAFSSGKASIVTDEIETFTPAGVRTKSGEEITADAIITATGFELSILGDIDFTIDGAPLDLSQSVTYRGMMFTGVPNLVWVFGYFRAAWTLRADLISQYICRVLAYLDERGYRSVTPELRPEDRNDELKAWMTPDEFNPSYLLRSMDKMPKRLDKPQWRHTQDYFVEKELFPTLDVAEDCLQYR